MSSDAKSLRATRKLQDQSFEVPLFLALHFVSGTTASALETRDSANDIVRHLCNATQVQVRRGGWRSRVGRVMILLRNFNVQSCRASPR
jgi:hypothetical protein